MEVLLRCEKTKELRLWSICVIVVCYDGSMRDFVLCVLGVHMRYKLLDGQGARWLAVHGCTQPAGVRSPASHSPVNASNEGRVRGACF
jgi:hypothetical protein